MEFWLGTILKREGDHKIEFNEEITMSQHDELMSAIKEIQNIEDNKRLFEIVFLNKNDFVDTVNRDIEELATSPLSLSGHRVSYYKHHLNFNRLFLNYLGSIKTFVDHNETAIKRKYGPNSVQADTFKKITNYYFDKFFCYRFFIKLRNYALHCGMPLHSFGLNTERIENKGYLKSAKIEFSTKVLLENFSDWGRIVTKDLNEKGDSFPLAPLIDDMTKVLIGFWDGINKIYTQEVCRAAVKIKAMTNSLRGENLDVCIFSDVKTKKDGSIDTFESFTIPLDIVDTLDTTGCE